MSAKLAVCGQSLVIERVKEEKEKGVDEGAVFKRGVEVGGRSPRFVVRGSWIVRLGRRMLRGRGSVSRRDRIRAIAVRFSLSSKIH